ncbi:probable ribonuclease ZC3H12C [Lineus longissimus]|uniref:probable ribonuclease ZC3H12C n=1 Tax=Lineus longissimus TaxID=88925 RepID=UPI002B4F2D87
MNSVNISQKNEKNETDEEVNRAEIVAKTGLDDVQFRLDASGGRDSCDLRNVNVNSEIFTTQDYLNRVKFAFKLGFSEGQLKIALSELGTAAPKDNDLLQELIKLGSIGKSIDEESDLEDEDVFDEEDAILQPKTMEKLKDAESNLRPIVIDGSNVAMSHGNKETFSCYGIKLAVDFFRQRGHKEIHVFVPQWRKETPRPDSPITNQEVLFQLEGEKVLCYTPSRRIGGKRVVCYDDRYIIKLAAETNGIVVSNDNYRDLINEESGFKKVIEERLLMFSFVNDRFMPPADPLGRHGPTLDNYLQKEPSLPETLPPICPYLKKCTYGNKCKYYHPERGNKPQKLITEKLAEEAQLKMIQVTERQLSEQNDDSLDAKSKLTKDDVKPSMEDKERQKKHNENLDHYRRQVEESERKAARAQSQTEDNQENDSLPVVFPPPHLSGRVSDGTHLSVAKTLSDESTAYRPGLNQRRRSVPNPEQETELLRRQFSRQMSLQSRLERQGSGKWSTYRTGPEPTEAHSPLPQAPSQSVLQTLPPRADIGYRQQPPMSDYVYQPHMNYHPDYHNPNLGGQMPLQGMRPSSMSYPHPAMHQRASRNFQPSYPPVMRYGGGYMQQTVHQSVSNLSQRWVPATGYEAPMFPELPDQNIPPLSYVTGPPVENEVDYRLDPQQDLRYNVPLENPYCSTVPENSTLPPIPAPCQITDPSRYAVYVNLSNIYGEETVRRVMHDHPNEIQAHIIATYAAGACN